MKFLIKYSITSFVIIILAGCSSTGSYTSRKTDFKLPKTYIDEISEQNMNYEGIRRNPVIVVHGFQGANLKNSKTGEIFWGEFKSSDAILGNDRKLREFSHPMKQGVRLEDLMDNVIPDGILKKVKIAIMGITVETIAYNSLIQCLKYGGYQPESDPLAAGKNYNTLFEFAYDWRKDLPGNAKLLDKFIKEKKKYIQKQYETLYGIKNFDVQFNIVAHSMGGLLSRYYLRYGAKNLPEDGSLPEITWDGSKHLDTVVIVGTPNAGYLDTFLEMLGENIMFIPLASLGTLPTYYQMLPAPETKSILYLGSNETVDYFNPELWSKMNWGIMNPEEDETLKILLPEAKTKEERRQIAYDHLSKCLKRAKQFIDAMKVKADPPDDVSLLLIFGHGIKTSRRAYINKNTGKIEKIEYAFGDGKVLSTSALWDERAGGKWSVFVSSPIKWSGIALIRAAHMGIFEAPAFEDNLLFHLVMVESAKQKIILKNY